VVDLGPEGGDKGGQILYSGPTKGLTEIENSYTGKYLKKYYE
jgi:excinuclease ABC subunit A